MQMFCHHEQLAAPTWPGPKGSDHEQLIVLTEIPSSCVQSYSSQPQAVSNQMLLHYSWQLIVGQ